MGANGRESSAPGVAKSRASAYTSTEAMLHKRGQEHSGSMIPAAATARLAEGAAWVASAAKSRSVWSARGSPPLSEHGGRYRPRQSGAEAHALQTLRDVERARRGEVPRLREVRAVCRRFGMR